MKVITRAIPAPAITAQATPAIVSPFVDAFCTGGLSLLVLVPLLLMRRTDVLIVSIGAQAWLGALVNMPHFLASYRMVYRTRDTIRKHPWAAIYVPVLLLAACITAVVASRWSDIPISALLTVSNTYLAWHYTGQAWGMVATFTHLDGNPLNGFERRLIRGSLFILAAWHVVWFFHFGYDQYVDLTPLYTGLSILTAAALVMGLAGFAMHKARTGRVAPLPAWIPWIAIFVWYAAMGVVGLPALFIVQIAHALQYLIFPLRVEINRTRRVQVIARDSGPAQRLALHILLYVILLLLGSIVAAILLPLGAMAVVTDWLGSRPGEVVGFAITAFFNIHHYFTDGVVWKLRDPAVRADLLGHIRR
ncbi:MAG TPA: hypothetical protein VG454_05585 [Gemmatimonadales bacterium]|nr:hypothetical protein [Gemmatimonadales bacterium]